MNSAGLYPFLSLAESYQLQFGSSIWQPMQKKGNLLKCQHVRFCFLGGKKNSTPTTLPHLIKMVHRLLSTTLLVLIIHITVQVTLKGLVFTTDNRQHCYLGVSSYFHLNFEKSLFNITLQHCCTIGRK